MTPRIPILAAICALTATGASAFEFDTTAEASEVRTDHPYAILGLAPGDAPGRIEAVGDEKGIPISVAKGTLTVGDGAGNRMALDMDYAFGTVGYGNVYQYRNEPSYDILEGDLTTNATGNVAAGIERRWKIEETDAPSWEALRGQLVDTYGAPSWEADGRAEWVHGPDGEKLAYEAEPGGPDDPNGCALGEAQFDYIADPESIETPCSVQFSVTMQGNILTFRLVDYALRDADRREAAEQINAEFASDDEATDLDL